MSGHDEGASFLPLQTMLSPRRRESKRFCREKVMAGRLLFADSGR